MYKVTLTALTAALLLTACGGSDNKASHKPSTPQVKMDSKVNDYVIMSGGKKALEKTSAEENLILDSYTMTIAGKSYPYAQNITGKTFAQGFSENSYKDIAQFTDKRTGEKFTSERKGVLYVFQQKYSSVLAINLDEVKITKKDESPETVEFKNALAFYEMSGIPTTTLPKAGTYHYLGNAYTAKVAQGQPTWQKGDLSYKIDFEKKSGHGSLQFDSQIIQLANAPIGKYKHENADDSSLMVFGVEDGKSYANDGQQGTYRLGIFGQDASEISGVFTVGNDTLGMMGGSKK